LLLQAPAVLLLLLLVYDARSYCIICSPRCRNSLAAEWLPFQTSSQRQDAGDTRRAFVVMLPYADTHKLISNSARK